MNEYIQITQNSAFTCKSLNLTGLKKLSTYLEIKCISSLFNQNRLANEYGIFPGSWVQIRALAKLPSGEENKRSGCSGRNPAE